MITIDINCDLGEGRGPDARIMPLISSCNVACGGHYGTPQTMRDTIRLAQKHQVAIGAHPSYPDQRNFGRMEIDLSPDALKATLTAQLTTFSEIMKKENANLHHVKAHGALYHKINREEEAAKTLIKTVKNLESGLIVYAPPHSIIHDLADEDLRTWKEGFGDRKYNKHYELVSRKKAGAVLHQKEEVLEQIVSMVKDRQIPVDRTVLPCHFNTICVHSDTPECLEILQYLNHYLPLKGIRIQ